MAAKQTNFETKKLTPERAGQIRDAIEKRIFLPGKTLYEVAHNQTLDNQYDTPEAFRTQLVNYAKNYSTANDQNKIKTATLSELISFLDRMDAPLKDLTSSCRAGVGARNKANTPSDVSPTELFLGEVSSWKLHGSPAIPNKKQQLARLKELAPSINWSKVPDKALADLLPRLDKLKKEPNESIIKDLLLEALSLYTPTEQKTARRIKPLPSLDEQEHQVHPNDLKMLYAHQTEAFASRRTH